jgi:hypothetical protein
MMLIDKESAPPIIAVPNLNEKVPDFIIQNHVLSKHILNSRPLAAILGGHEAKGKAEL